jgi:hypothetical protein
LHQVIEDRLSVADRRAVAGVHRAIQRADAVVHLDGEVERILPALVPHLVDLFLNGADLLDECVGNGLESRIDERPRRSVT